MKIAVGSLTTLVGGVGIWQGVGYFSSPAPAGPTQQVSTGVDATGGGTVQPIGATLSDDQLPQPTNGNYQFAQYQASGNAPATQPQTNPYFAQW
ncbi:MAG: hypothetical protein QM778_00565 [Myxococcales bacterium]